MGDEIQQNLPLSSDNFQPRQRDNSPHSLARSGVQQEVQQNMEFEVYPQQRMAMSNYGGGATMDMRNLAGALPDYSIQQYPQQPFQHQIPQQVPSNQTMMFHYSPGTQFAGQTGTNYHPNPAPQYHPQYMQQHAGRPQQTYPGYTVAQPGSQGFQNQAVQIQPEFGHNQPQQFLQLPSGQYVSGYGGRVGGNYPQPQVRMGGNVNMNQAIPMYQQLVPQPIRRTSSNSSLQTSTIRGPPRKPKQSGYALWVGNLPPGTHIIDLKDHFSRDATHDIESVFLISKSNCAFVNYKTESSCAAAMSRFHDSRFQGVRLVCRLRRGSAPSTGTVQPSSATAPAPAPSSSTTFPQTSSEGNLKSEGAAKSEEAEPAAQDLAKPEPGPQSTERVKEKFFVVKSLTIEDLERSVHTGVWATQAHNEDALNKAYQTAESVYLIFSANKSGEYFGYARMDSAIDDEAAAQIEPPSRPETLDPAMTDLPLTIPTPATATAPKGKIIDDSSRGTIFWEADSEEKEEGKEEDPGNTSGEGYESAVSTGGASPATPQAFGKPFKIVWVSTERLPFYRTRGLRNPWNSNREVKIARDGTEIEPSIGRRLVAMFHRPHIASASPGSRQPGTTSQIQSGYGPAHGQPPGNPYGRQY